MNQREGCHHVLVCQVVIEPFQLMGHGESLVNHFVSGETAYVEIVFVFEFGFFDCPFYLLANYEQPLLEAKLIVGVVAVRHHELPDEGHDPG